MLVLSALLGCTVAMASKADTALAMNSPELSAQTTPTRGTETNVPVLNTVPTDPIKFVVPQAATAQPPVPQTATVPPISTTIAASGIPVTPDTPAATAEPATQAPAPIREAMIVAPASPNGDLWQRIRAGYAMKDLDSPLIKRHEKWYANHPDYVLRMSERAQHYLFYIMEEVDRRGMPSEIALLPVIESAFNPGANSIASASGIWQFIPSTGKHFGMEQNWWHDGRRDIIGATNGALDYLQKLHDQFGDWELALAAYNWGENGVTRAQAYNRKHHKPTDYSHLRMPRETRNYVPKLLAVKNIIADPARFGLQLSKIPDEPYFATVATSQHIDVKVAAELADISMDEFIALNPGHNRPVILQDKDNGNVLLLPVDKVDTFRTNLAKTNQRLVSWQPYESKKGESFDKIATHFGLSLAELRSANGLSKYAQESNGQTLLVPIPDDQPATDFAAFNMHPSAVAEMYGAVRYTVRRGDTISTIARRFHVSQMQLREANHGVSRLHVGQHFNIVLADHRSARRHHVAATRAKTRTSLRKASSVKVAYNAPQSKQPN
jgi:membrane-bound lytic murein transglycosylase D